MPKIAEKVLTAKAIEKLKPDAQTVREIPDGIIRGLSVRVMPSGAKSFALRLRITDPAGNRKQRRVVIGTWPEMTLEAARIKAGHLKAEGLPAIRTEAAETFGDLAEHFIKHGMFSKRTGRKLKRAWEVERIIRRQLLPDWQDVPLEALKAKDAVRLTDALLDEGKPAAACKLHEIIRRIGSYGAQRGRWEVSPFASMEAPRPPVRRDRVLSDSEIKALWSAWTVEGYPFGQSQQMLLLTGQRRAEVSGMTWGEIDRTAKVWTIPGKRTKNDLENIVPLSAFALEVLDALPRFDKQALLFSTTGKTAISGYSKAKARTDKAAGVSDWRIHDLRRTMRTGLAALGVGESVAEKLLNHQPRNVLTSIYNRHEYIEEKRAAMEAWGERMREVVG